VAQPQDSRVTRRVLNFSVPFRSNRLRDAFSSAQPRDIPFHKAAHERCSTLVPGLSPPGGCQTRSRRHPAAPAAPFFERLHGSQRHLVIAGQHGSKRRTAVQDLMNALITAIIHVPPVNHDPWVASKPKFKSAAWYALKRSPVSPCMSSGLPAKKAIRW
jgi:hypothetical protein